MSEIHDLYLTTEALLKKHVPHSIKIEKIPGCYRTMNFNPDHGLRLTEGICGNAIADAPEGLLLDHVAMLEELQVRAAPYLPLLVEDEDEAPVLSQRAEDAKKATVKKPAPKKRR